ncbi:MAG: 5-(carboxyamino)imidazole ribonucleotide synthase [Armatimonadetes bacterium]|nr:5-(carboxyamino)imidazole ribonucleotide synthase [Armatimonadota bacterium]MDE2206192.1 5-(carboxyamino)imidazole ribonucleotide synthase [Armatimonadota bacterium]
MKIGILGAGQLGRMLALAGLPLGMEFRFFDPEPQATAGKLAPLVSADWRDRDALHRFAEGVDAVTLEFENVPVETALLLAEATPVYPPPAALAVAQDRLNEKRLFQQCGIPTPQFAPANSLAELKEALEITGLPAVAKTRRLGYDGKGQMVLRDMSQAEACWAELGGQPLVIEQFVPFLRELSQVVARGHDGSIADWSITRNVHREGMLRLSEAGPETAAGTTSDTAREYASRLAVHLEYRGVLALEMFQTEQGLMANEIAPRVHNSGHWTQDGAETCQFENHLRAVAGWPMGDCSRRSFSAMVNLIGAVPAPQDVLRCAGAHLHLYGKSARPGRKLGHINVTAESAVALRDRLRPIARITPCPDFDAR